MQALLNLFKIVFLLIFISCNASAYSQAAATGLYMRADDLLNQHVTFSGGHTHIHIHDLFKRKTIYVTQNDSSYLFLKTEVYGYTDKYGNAYRFFKDAVYTIINPLEKIIIYKRTSGTGLKNSPVTETYFFSRTAASDILPLTLMNVEHCFEDCTAFQDLIALCFGSDNTLTAYDHLHHLYKINRLFQLYEQATNTPNQ